MLNNVLVGISLGIVSTVCVHLGKSMERHGIETFSRDKSLKEKGKKPLIYSVGFVLNQSIILWQLIAMQFASAAVFASMFGLGIVVVMIYSYFFLHERISRSEISGAIMIMVGSIVIGIIFVIQAPSKETINIGVLYVVVIFTVFALIGVLAFSVKSKIGIALLLGLVAGFLGAMDNVLKRVGLKYGILKVGDINTLPFFILSFAFAWAAFFVCQYGFAKGANASKLIPAYNSMYISIPIAFELLLYGVVELFLFKIMALAIISAGIFLMFIRKDTKKKEGEIVLIQREKISVSH